jgi:hypothetical protein
MPPHVITLSHPVRDVRLLSNGDVLDGGIPEMLESPETTQPLAPPPTSSPAGLSPEQFAELMASMTDAIGELEKKRKNNLTELQEATVELATIVASRVVRTAVDRGDYRIDELARELLAKCSIDEPVRMLLNPADLAVIQAEIHTNPALLDRPVDLRGDLTIGRGQCRVVSGSRTLIADWRTHLQDIRAVLHEELEHAQIERRGAHETDQRVKRFPDRRETA